ncbi:hypothetical protein ACET3Z_030517 [Daucus carota]
MLLVKRGAQTLRTAHFHALTSFTLMPPIVSTPISLFHSHFLLFSTKPNPDSQPKPPFIPSPSTTHPELKQLLYHKSKVGFDKLEDALLVFDKMLLLKSGPLVLQFNQLLTALVRMKEYSVAVSMFRELRVLSIPVDIVTFNTAIHSCCHLNTLDYAFSLLAGIIKSGWVPDVFTYTTLIKGLLSQDRPLEAGDLFNKLITYEEIHPDVVTHNTVIDGLRKTSNTSMALKLLRKMEEIGCRPDTITYTSIIDSLCKERRVDHALDLLSEMIVKGIPPNVITYTTLIQGLCISSRWEDIEPLLSEMGAQKIRPDLHTYSILVNAYCKQGRTKDAQDVIDIMIEKSVPPDVITYSTLMDGYCLTGKMDRALEVLNTMRSNGIAPDCYSYTILINGYCQGGLFEEAKILLSEMETSGCLPDDVTYNTIIRGSLLNKRYEEAVVLIENMRAHNFSADASTTSMVVDLLPKEEQKEQEEQDPAVLAFAKWFLQ